MKTFESTAGCGYGEYALLVHVRDRDYLCIWSNEKSDYPIHKEGELIKDLEDIYLTERDVDITKFPIYKTFLFQHFVTTTQQTKQS